MVHASVAFDCDKTGEIYVFNIRNALHVPEMQENLIHPIMMRLVGVEVDKCPKFLSQSPSIVNHLVFFPEANLCMPLKLDGIVSYLPCRKPTLHELEYNDGIFELTPNVSKWNPSFMNLDIQEESMIDFAGNIKEHKPHYFVISMVAFRGMDPIIFSDDIGTFMGVLSVKLSDRKGNMNGIKLSGKWKMSKKLARRTIATTTRLCPRNTTEISLNRRYTCNDRML
mmetsp:Transcript_9777/g.13824  ORF Transcript_9777/g.13824 Transcript_9777/m.13824 type:complete len:225 (+) Transcript_9777:683-1357(+)